MVREKGLWPLQRVHGYHMNGNPKPWSPLWRAACAYPSAHRKDTAKYEDFYTEWWKYYHDFAQVGLTLCSVSMCVNSNELVCSSKCGMLPARAYAHTSIRHSHRIRQRVRFVLVDGLADA
jgi:hypothetical protein